MNSAIQAAAHSASQIDRHALSDMALEPGIKSRDAIKMAILQTTEGE